MIPLLKNCTLTSSTKTISNSKSIYPSVFEIFFVGLALINNYTYIRSNFLLFIFNNHERITCTI